MLVTSIFFFSHNVYKRSFLHCIKSCHCVLKGKPFTTKFKVFITLKKEPFATRAVTKCDLLPARALTETRILYTDIHTDGWTHRQADSSICPKTFLLQGYESCGNQLFLLNLLYSKISLFRVSIIGEPRVFRIISKARQKLYCIAPKIFQLFRV